MTSNLIISNFSTGYETDREPFIINNDAFPTLINAYVWRGRILKKKGTSLLGRLRRDLTSQNLGVTDGFGVFIGNIFTILGLNTISPDESIVPGSITVTIGAQVFTENIPFDGTLTNAGTGTGSINYNTGALIINTDPALPATAVLINFSYFPNLPVMGLEDFERLNVNFPDLVAFDTRYSYQYNQTTQLFYDTTFYKNSGSPFTFAGTNFQQFWSTNYQGAMWVTNGNPGFHFMAITAIPVVGANTQFTVPLHGLSNSDYVFINEVLGVTGVNGVSGLVTVIDPNNFTIPTPGAAGAYISGGIAQYLTRSTSSSIDGIRWYDGDFTTDPTKGWVNFAPPISNAVTPQYLIGAKIIVPFKNRLLFFGVTLATSAAPGGVFFPNRLVFSQVGTGYYSAPVPVNQTFDMRAYWTNVAGFGGFLNAPIPYEIVTVVENEDVLLCGFETKQLRLIFSADNSLPFFYQTINSELGSQNTFSGISLDTGGLIIGDYGIAMITQISAQRIDLQIPDQIFEISSKNNGSERVTAIRDFRNEFIYFTYPPKEKELNTGVGNIFNSKTLLYNYRDNTWAIFIENYTKYGTFRRTQNYTWATLPYDTWSAWTNPWNFGGQGQRYPNIIGGNQQGFVMIRDSGNREDTSQYIQDINLADPLNPIITSPDHCLNTDDYIEILNAIGVTNLNNEIFQIEIITQDTFRLVLSTTQSLNPPGGTYIGGGVYRRLTNINILTKQFPLYWEGGRQCRVGTQRFLIDNAPDGEITIQVFNSQAPLDSNDQLISDYLIFSDILLTRPEPENPNQENQNQIWHRMSNSFVGDSVQIGFILSDAQMRDNDINSAEIGIHAIVLNLYPGPILA